MGSFMLAQPAAMGDSDNSFQPNLSDGSSQGSCRHTAGHHPLCSTCKRAVPSHNTHPESCYLASSLTRTEQFHCINSPANPHPLSWGFFLPPYPGIGQRAKLKVENWVAPRASAQMQCVNCLCCTLPNSVLTPHPHDAPLPKQTYESNNLICAFIPLHDRTAEIRETSTRR